MKVGRAYSHGTESRSDVIYLKADRPVAYPKWALVHRRAILFLTNCVCPDNTLCCRTFTVYFFLITDIWGRTSGWRMVCFCVFLRCVQQTWSALSALICEVSEAFLWKLSNFIFWCTPMFRECSSELRSVHTESKYSLLTRVESKSVFFSFVCIVGLKVMF